MSLLPIRNSVTLQPDILARVFIPSFSAGLQLVSAVRMSPVCMEVRSCHTHPLVRAIFLAYFNQYRNSFDNYFMLEYAKLLISPWYCFNMSNYLIPLPEFTTILSPPKVLLNILCHQHVLFLSFKMWCQHSSLPLFPHTGKQSTISLLATVTQCWEIAFRRTFEGDKYLSLLSFKT